MNQGCTVTVLSLGGRVSADLEQAIKRQGNVTQPVPFWSWPSRLTSLGPRDQLWVDERSKSEFTDDFHDWLTRATGFKTPVFILVKRGDHRLDKRWRDRPNIAVCHA